MPVEPTPDVAQFNWWFALGATAINAVVIAALGAWAKSGFEKKIEDLRSALRRDEEQRKALVQGVMAGEIVRAELTARRRVEVIEEVWCAVQAWGRFELAPTFLQRVNLDEVKKVKSIDDIEKVRKWFGEMARALPENDKLPEVIRCADLYLSPVASNLYAAYCSCLSFSFMVMRGVEKVGPGFLEFTKFDSMNADLLKALPGNARFIEENQTSAAFYLYKQIRQELFSALLKELDGQSVHEQAIGRMAETLGRADAAWTQGLAGKTPPSSPIPGLLKEPSEIPQTLGRSDDPLG